MVRIQIDGCFVCPSDGRITTPFLSPTNHHTTQKSYRIFICCSITISISPDAHHITRKKSEQWLRWVFISISICVLCMNLCDV